ncbi:MAG: carboxypeptidase regulatory-like domain-containing protein [Candidatus Acidiferrales bacterium]
MRKMWTQRMLTGIMAASGLMIVTATLFRTEARPHPGATANPQARPNNTAGGADYIGGVVTSPNGPEAGVWVIAETADLPTKFRKIVVTDDAGRYMLPELPKANYKIWVRGYGLVDSKAVEATPGKTLALTAVIAHTPKDAAQYYPGDYWFSLIKMPPKSDFPMKLRANDGGLAGEEGGSAPVNFAPTRDTEVATQAQWSFLLKRGCEVCHQMGDKATREIEPGLGAFDKPEQAWERRLMSGQVGPQMTNALNSFGHDRGLAMFADWSTRIAAGEVPPAPPRPQGIERNVVISLWEFGTNKSFFHDIGSSDDRHPTANANGPIYGTDFSGNAIAVLDPSTGKNSMIGITLRNEHDRALLQPFTPQTVGAPSPYWGDELIWNDRVTSAQPRLDSKGRFWFHSQTRADLPDWCKASSNNPYAKIFPIPDGTVARGGTFYDPKSGKFGSVDTCLPSGHMVFADDKDETLYYASTPGVGPDHRGGIGWIKTRVWDETHDSEKAVGWCLAVIDYNGDGKTGAFTRPNETADPKLDREVRWSNGYGVAVNPVDGSVWYAGLGNPVPGRIFRMVTGTNPPETCKTEVYEPPFDNPKRPGVEAYSTLGLAIDSNGLVWTALAGSNDLASFDRSKCAGPLNGPTATGQHCPEGWTLYPVPGPKFKGSDVLADSFYHNWVDRFDTLGLGKDVPIVTGTGSDSLIAFLPQTKKFVTLRVPYPMSFYTRLMDGRIDDPSAGWKGRGVWTANETRVVWHVEGGKGTRSSVAHFQIRPDPLAK